MFPAGVRIVTPATDDNTASPSTPKRKPLQRVRPLEAAAASEDRALYHLFFLKQKKGFPDGQAVFGGPRTKLDQQILTFMLGESRNREVPRVCLHVNERQIPSTQRILDEARRLHAIPVFHDGFLGTDEIVAHGDVTIDMPLTVHPSRVVVNEQAWADLAAASTADARTRLTAFSRAMSETRQASPGSHASVRAYLLGARDNPAGVVQPALIIQQS